MEKSTWKTLALVSWSVLIAGVIFIFVAISIGEKEIEKEQICLYEMGDNYDYSYYQDGICYLYDYDMLGNLNLVDEEIVKLK